MVNMIMRMPKDVIKNGHDKIWIMSIVRYELQIYNLNIFRRKLKLLRKLSVKRKQQKVEINYYKQELKLPRYKLSK